MKALILTLIFIFAACGSGNSSSNQIDQDLPDQSYFVTDWQVDNDLSIKMQTHLNYDYDYDIDCDSDGTWEGTGIKTTYLCEYQEPGAYRIVVRGTFPHFRGYYSNGKLITVAQWGDQQWRSFEGSFINCGGLKDFTAVDQPDLSRVENFNYIFWGASGFNGDISGWDTSSVKTMNLSLFNATSFNRDLSGWAVDNVEHHSLFSNSLQESKQPQFRSKK